MPRVPRRVAKPLLNKLAFDVEALEKKQMLAGTVTATITGAGHLVINGDSNDNNITVEVSAAGDVDITANDGETIIDNGFSSSQLSGDVRINLRGGDDYIYLDGPVYSNSPIDDVRIVGGAGDDYINARHLSGLSGNVKISGGGGSDYLALKYSDVSGNVSISGGSGDDMVGASYNEDISGNLRISTGGGNDSVYMVGATVQGNASVLTGSGNDNAYIKENSFSGNARLSMGGGNDSVIASLNPLIAVGGGGFDDIARDDTIDHSGFESVT